MAEEKKLRIVYALKNDYFDGMLKIGSSADIKKRIGNLNSAVPTKFQLVYACETFKSHKEVEKIIHNILKDKRVDSSEFYKVDSIGDIEYLFNLFLLAGKNVTAEVLQLLGSKLQDNSKDTIEAPIRKPKMNFYEMNLKDGDCLSFIKDINITCTIASANKVLYNGERKSLSEVTKELLGYNVQPSPLWKFEGKYLYDIYIEKQVNNA